MIKQCSKCNLRQKNGRGIITAYIPTLEKVDLCPSCLVDNYQSLQQEDKRKVQILE
jgi:hypothetical protein